MADAGHSEFDLDARVGRWRTRQERTSSLSPRELDELEDHLRAHVDLEMAAALRLRDRQWASARLSRPTRAPGQGAFE